MRRREVIAALGGAATSWSLMARAQLPRQMRRIGFLRVGPPPAAFIDGFRQGMREQHRVPDGENWDETIFNVFRKKDGVIRHFWGSEMSFAPPAPQQHHRAGDLADPLWGLLDMTPEGRGDFFPKVNYG